MNSAIKLATIALAIFCTGCGTTKETLFVNSDPTGAQVTLSNGMTGATPCSFLVPLSEKTLVTIEKDGYQSTEVAVAKKVSKNMVAGRAVAAVLVAPIVAVGGSGGGGVIGPVSKLEPNPVSVKLLPLPKNLPPQKNRAD